MQKLNHFTNKGPQTITQALQQQHCTDILFNALKTALSVLHITVIREFVVLQHILLVIVSCCKSVSSRPGLAALLASSLLLALALCWQQTALKCSLTLLHTKTLFSCANDAQPTGIGNKLQCKGLHLLATYLALL